MLIEVAATVLQNKLFDNQINKGYVGIKGTQLIVYTDKNWKGTTIPKFEGYSIIWKILE